MHITFTVVMVFLFVMVYFFLITDIRHRTAVVMVGSSVVIFVAKVFYQDPTNFWLFIDFDTLALLTGMMLIVGLLSHSGFFEYLGVKVLKYSKGDPKKFFFGIFFVTAVTSAFLDNVTTVLLMTPMILYVTNILGINPVPFLLGELWRLILVERQHLLVIPPIL